VVFGTYRPFWVLYGAIVNFYGNDIPPPTSAASYLCSWPCSPG
jgi:hypothetical protein